MCIFSFNKLFSSADCVGGKWIHSISVKFKVISFIVFNIKTILFFRAVVYNVHK